MKFKAKTIRPGVESDFIFYMSEQKQHLKKTVHGYQILKKLHFIPESIQSSFHMGKYCPPLG